MNAKISPSDQSLITREIKSIGHQLLLDFLHDGSKDFAASFPTVNVFVLNDEVMTIDFMVPSQPITLEFDLPGILARSQDTVEPYSLFSTGCRWTPLLLR